MRKIINLVFGLFILVSVGLFITSTVVAENGKGSGPVIYVTSQGLYYDSIITADPLPPHGPFQLLEMGGPHGGLQTEFGPGNKGYVGGRWKEDFDGNGIFHYFSCPLLGPGRDNP
jgi:hypothetical protein